MLAVRLRDNQHADRAMLLRVQDFHASRGVARVARAVEDRVGIGLLRFVIENQHDFSARVDSLVVVVMQLWRGDAKTGEHHVRRHIDVRTVRAQRIRIFPLLLAAAAPERHVAVLAVRAIFNQLDGLQEAALRGRF